MNVTLQQQDDVDKNHHTSTGQEGLKSTQFEERLITSWFDGDFWSMDWYAISEMCVSKNMYICTIGLVESSIQNWTNVESIFVFLIHITKTSEFPSHKLTIWVTQPQEKVKKRTRYFQKRSYWTWFQFQMISIHLSNNDTAPTFQATKKIVSSLFLSTHRGGNGFSSKTVVLFVDPIKGFLGDWGGFSEACR